jgi:hypothetical protein
VVIYGCMSGKAPTWPWQAWVFRDLKVRCLLAHAKQASQQQWYSPSARSLACALLDRPLCTQVSGFNLRKWVAANRGRVGPMLEALGRLVSANMLTLAYTEYDLASELSEALGHALDSGRNTKVLLSCAGAAAELAAALKL